MMVKKQVICQYVFIYLLMIFTKLSVSSQLRELNEQIYQNLSSAQKVEDNGINGILILLVQKQDQNVRQTRSYKIINEIVKASEGIIGVYAQNNSLSRKLEGLLKVDETKYPKLIYINGKNQKYLYPNEQITKGSFYKFIKDMNLGRIKQIQSQNSMIIKQDKLIQLSQQSIAQFLQNNNEKIIRFYCAPEKPYSKVIGSQFLKTTKIFHKFTQISFAQFEIVSNKKIFKQMIDTRNFRFGLNQQQIKQILQSCETSNILLWGTNSYIQPVKYNGQADHQYIKIWIKNSSEFPLQINNEEL